MRNNSREIGLDAKAEAEVYQHFTRMVGNKTANTPACIGHRQSGTDSSAEQPVAGTQLLVTSGLSRVFLSRRLLQRAYHFQLSFFKSVSLGIYCFRIADQA